MARGPRPEADLRPGILWNSIVDVAGRSDWQSPLYVASRSSGALAARFAAAGTGLWGFVVLPFLDLVAADPPAGPILAAAFAPAGDSRGPGADWTGAEPVVDSARRCL